jgi:hypothetical protein
MATELVTMSTREIDRLDVVRRVVERRLTQDKAGQSPPRARRRREPDISTLLESGHSYFALTSGVAL